MCVLGGFALMALCRPRTCCLVSAVTIGVLSILVAAVLYPVLDKVIKDAITKVRYVIVTLISSFQCFMF